MDRGKILGFRGEQVICGKTSPTKFSGVLPTFQVTVYMIDFSLAEPPLYLLMESVFCYVDFVPLASSGPTWPPGPVLGPLA